jgi:flagellar basal body rod protein FlgG
VAGGAVGPASGQVRQGYLELSGTNPTDELMQLIEASRAYEANVNLIRYHDEALGRLLSDVPRLP